MEEWRNWQWAVFATALIVGLPPAMFLWFRWVQLWLEWIWGR